MVRIAGINENDTTNGEGICVSVFFQGCPHHCKGCQNPETWAFEGHEMNYFALENLVLDAINANGIQRNLSLSGGDPLCEENLPWALMLLAAVKHKNKDIKTTVWTGYTLEQLKEKYGTSIFRDIDTLIDGPFILEQRDITLKLRGSKNQRILRKRIDF